MDAVALVVTLLVGAALAWGVVRHVGAAEKKRASKTRGEPKRDVAPPQLRPEDRRQLVPRIRTHSHIEHLRQRGATGDNALVYEPLVGELVVAYGIDMPSIFRMVAERDLEHLGVERPDLRAIAVSNLAERPEGRGRFPGDDEFGMVAFPDWAATLLLLDAIWDDRQKTLRGAQLAAVPSRDVLMVADSHYRPAIQLLRDAVRDELENAGPAAISRQIFVRRAGHWHVYESDDRASDDEE